MFTTIILPVILILATLLCALAAGLLFAFAIVARQLTESEKFQVC